MRSIYFAAFALIVTAPWVLPPIGRTLGMSRAWYRTQFAETLALCCLAAMLLGVTLFITLSTRGHWLAWLVLCTGPVLVYFCLGALGQA